MDKEITIVIPVYNSEKYLSRCLESILAQSVQNFKVLLINDGSTDGSQKIIEQYKSQYGDIIECIVQSNMGVAKTRNKAIQLVKTQYIMFVDDDDFLDNDYVDTHYSWIENEQLDIVISGYRRVNESGQLVTQMGLSDTQWSKMIILTPWCRIFRTSFLRENEIYFLDNNIGEDIYFNLLANFHTDRIKVLEYIGYNWFYNENSVSNTKQRDIHEVNIYKVLNSSYDELKKRNLLDKNYEFIETYFIIYVQWFIGYSTYKMSYRSICEEYDNLYGWLKEHFPDYKKNHYIGFTKPREENYKTRLYNKGLLVSNKLGFGKIVLFVFSRVYRMK